MTFDLDPHGFPVATAQGVRCGNHPLREVVRHANVDAVYACFYRTWELEDKVVADHLAERRVEERCGYDWGFCDTCGTPESQICPETCSTRVAEELQERFANSY